MGDVALMRNNYDLVKELRLLNQLHQIETDELVKKYLENQIVLLNNKMMRVGY